MLVTITAASEQDRLAVGRLHTWLRRDTDLARAVELPAVGDSLGTSSELFGRNDLWGAGGSSAGCC